MNECQVPMENGFTKLFSGYLMISSLMISSLTITFMVFDCLMEGWLLFLPILEGKQLIKYDQHDNLLWLLLLTAESNYEAVKSIEFHGSVP